MIFRFLSISTLLFFSTTCVQAQLSTRFSFGNITINTTDSDSVTVTVENGDVKINGNDPDSVTGLPGPGVPASETRTILINGDDGPNTIDLSAVTPDDFTILILTDIDTAGGDDTITGSDFGDKFVPGTGMDTIISWGGGFDEFIWRTGDGSETIDKGSEPDGYRFKYQSEDQDSDLSITSSVEDIVDFVDHVSSEVLTIVDSTDATIEGGTGNDSLFLNVQNNAGFSPTTIFLRGGNNFVDAFQTRGTVSINVSDLSVNNDFTLPVFGNSQINYNPASFSDSAAYVLTQTGDEEFTVLNGDLNSTGTTVFRNPKFFFFSGTNEDDFFDFGPINSDVLNTLRASTRQGTDTVSTHFYEMINQTITGNGTNSFDRLIVNAEGAVVEETASSLTPQNEKRPISISSIDEIIILNQGIRLEDNWFVD